jgi:hypothetical protein
MTFSAGPLPIFCNTQPVLSSYAKVNTGFLPVIADWRLCQKEIASDTPETSSAATDIHFPRSFYTLTLGRALKVEWRSVGPTRYPGIHQ